MGFNLQKKYSVIIVSMIIVIVAILAGTLLYQFKASMRHLTQASSSKMSENLLNREVKRAEGLTRLVVESLITPLYMFDTQAMLDILKAVKAQKDVLYAVVYDPKGKIVHDGTENVDQFGKLIEGVESRKALSEKGKLLTTVHDDALHVSMPVWIEDMPLGGFIIGLSLEQLNRDIPQMRHQLAEIGTHGLKRNLSILGVTTVVVIVLGIFISIAIVVNLVRPIRQVANYATEIGHGNYEVASVSERKDEIGDLLNAFYQMTQDLKRTTVSKDRLEEQAGELAKANRQLRTEVEVRLRMQEELKQARDSAEGASLAKSEFVANMSHEIRTPLNGIIGMTELIDEFKLDENHKELFQTINSEANALLYLINDILDFSKIEAKRLELEAIPFDLRDLIEDVSTNLAHRASQKGLEFISFVTPDIPTRLIGDPGRLRQIINNLAGNSLKFTSEGEIFVQAVLEQDLADQAKIRFLVKDTGIGIAEENLTNIFDSFTQADGSTSRKFGGTGLGTTISKQLAELMGGKIGAASMVGKGSTFWFSAVLSKQTGNQTTVIEQEDNPFGELRVLLAEDNSSARFVLSEYLKALGCSPTETSSSKEALLKLNDSVSSKIPFDLILLAFNMSESAGHEVVWEIISSDELKNIPMIITNSPRQTSETQKHKDLEVGGYLTKPIRMQDLKSAMESVLNIGQRDKGSDPKKVITKNATEQVQTKNIHILLAEDYPTNQQVAIRHLQKAGYQVDLAEDGRQAAAACRQKRYDLVLMDIQMPVMDGFRATEAIRSFESRSETNHPIPIIAMTAHAVKGYREKCIEAGMDDYISKPLRRKELIEMVVRWVH